MSLDVVMVEPTGHGGIAHYTYLLSSALVEAGVRPHVVTRAGWELADRPRAFDVTPALAAGQPWRVSARRIDALVRATRPSIVHLQAPLSTRKDALLVAWLRRRGARVVATAHNAVPHDGRWMDAIGQRLVYRAADHVVAHNEATRAALTRRFRVPADRISVVPHGEYAIFAEGAPSRDEARRRLGLTADEPVVLFFGALRPYKGVEVLLDAFARVRTEVPGSRLVIAGAVLVGHLSTYHDRARALGIESAVRFTARYLTIAEVAAHVRAADVSVFPYRMVWESGSLRVAIALGCPVVATDVGGLGDVVRDGVTGRLVRPDDPAALARGVVSLLADASAARAMAARALAEERDLRGWPSIAAATAALYRRLAAPAGAGEGG